jgi:hypothetical protein
VFKNVPEKILKLTVHPTQHSPKWAQNGPAQPGPARPTRARGADPRTRPQPGPGPGKPRPAWAKSGPCARGLTATVRSRSTVAHRSRRIKTRPRALSPVTLAHFSRSPSRSSFLLTTATEATAPPRASSPACALACA